MQSSTKTGSIRSIAVALDCSPHSRASLEAAAEMAARLGAELVGIFVEDINVLRLAGLPFVNEVRSFSAKTEKLDTGRIERLLGLQAKEARLMLQQAAEARAIRHSFRVLRGIVPEELMSAAPEADILVLGRSGRSPACRKGLGSTARAALTKGTKSVLLMRPGITATEGPLLLLYDGSEGSRHALGTTLELAGPKSTLHLLITDPSSDAEERCRQELSSTIELSGIETQYHHLPLSDGRQLVRLIRMIDSGLLVLSDRMNLPAETLNLLVNDIDYPVLVVRWE